MRSGSEHCGSRVAVEQEDEEDNERRRRGEEEEEEEEEDQATNIKSNNPHLAGGEQVQTVCSTSGFAIFLGKRKHTAGKEGIGGRAQLHHISGKAETWRNKKANKEETTEKQKAKKHDDRNKENKTEF